MALEADHPIDQGAARHTDGVVGRQKTQTDGRDPRPLETVGLLHRTHHRGARR
jgi:hypothetical protein